MTKRVRPYKECVICGKEAKDGNTRCASCRYKERVYHCVKCGKTKNSSNSRCMDCHPIKEKRFKELNYNWKGGQTKHSKGYIYEHVYESHPRMCNGYVFQHILVMEKHLGRYLDKGENVHHKNGVRSDNRIENLELWLVKQPSGQRVSDLIEWAKEILNKYGEDSENYLNAPVSPQPSKLEKG